MMNLNRTPQQSVFQRDGLKGYELLNSLNGHIIVVVHDNDAFEKGRVRGACLGQKCPVVLLLSVFDLAVLSLLKRIDLQPDELVEGTGITLKNLAVDLSADIVISPLYTQVRPRLGISSAPHLNLNHRRQARRVVVEPLLPAPTALAGPNGRVPCGRRI